MDTVVWVIVFAVGVTVCDAQWTTQGNPYWTTADQWTQQCYYALTSCSNLYAQLPPSSNVLQTYFNCVDGERSCLNTPEGYTMWADMINRIRQQQQYYGQDMNSGTTTRLALPVLIASMLAALTQFMSSS